MSHPPRVTAENAAAMAVEAKQQLADALRDQMDAELTSGPVIDESPAQDEASAPPEATPATPAEDHAPAPQDAPENDETASHEDAAMASLRQQYDQLDKRFRAIQSVITPVQQENARLRKQVAALEAALNGTMPEGVDPEDVKAHTRRKDLREKVSNLREVLPEGAEAIQSVLEELDSMRATTSSRYEQADHSSTSVLDQIRAVHPDADTIAQDATFWSWIDTLSPGVATAYREILANPGAAPDYKDAAIGIFSDFKGVMGSTQATPPRQAPPSAPPPQAPPRPTDMAVPVRQATQPGATSRQPKQPLSLHEIEALSVELRRANPARQIEIHKILREQQQLMASLRR